MSEQNDAGRDAEVARALEGIPVPEYEPGFWDRLDARLEQERMVASPAEATSVFASVLPIAGPEPTPVELTRVAPAAAGASRERRRSLGLLAAAAAVVLAVLAVRIGADDAGPLTTASGTEGSTRPGPADGTTTPAGGLERDGAEAEDSGVDDGPGSADDRTTGQGGPATDPSEIDLFSSSTVLHGTRGSTDSASATLQTSPKTPEDAFIAWATAIHDGDTDAAVALTGPRTARYYDALGSSSEELAESSEDEWGVWAEPDGRHIQQVELGTVDGERAVGLVLDRPAEDPADPDGRIYVGVPVVRGASGWRVEPAAFDPDTEGRIEVLSPEVGEHGFEDLPKGGVIKVAAAKAGQYYLGLDFSQETRIPAADAVDGVITWNPGGQKSEILHILVVAHIKAGQIVMLAQTFETAPA